jgi:hypothetical protein
MAITEIHKNIFDMPRCLFAALVAFHGVRALQRVCRRWGLDAVDVQLRFEWFIRVFRLSSIRSLQANKRLEHC